jgi:hypothetical protein
MYARSSFERSPHRSSGPPFHLNLYLSSVSTLIPTSLPTLHSFTSSVPLSYQILFPLSRFI